MLYCSMIKKKVKITSYVVKLKQGNLCKNLHGQCLQSTVNGVLQFLEYF